MIFKVKSKIIFNGTVYERGDLIDLPEGSDTRDLFLNKLEPVEDDKPVEVVEIQANFTQHKSKKAKKK